MSIYIYVKICTLHMCVSVFSGLVWFGFISLKNSGAQSGDIQDIRIFIECPMQLRH